jgi:Streptomycin adenylyltransferase.
MLEKAKHLAMSSALVEAAILIGSRARADHPADEFSDYDFVFIVEDPKSYVYHSDWLQIFGSFYISFYEPAVGDGIERRVIFESGIYADFLFYTADQFKRGLKSKEFTSLFQYGYKSLVDKKLILESLTRKFSEKSESLPPTADEFLNLVNNFWFHTVWTLKKLNRGELWSAKYCLDVYLKELLLKVIEWQTHCKKGWDYNIWHSGRFINEWADEHITRNLRYAFAQYEPESVRLALQITSQLFRELSTAVAEGLKYEYPQEAENFAATLIQID